MNAFSKPPYSPYPQERQPAPPHPSLPPEANTLVHVLRWRADHQPDRCIFSFLEDGKVEAGALTFRELDRRARRIASQLFQRGASGRCAILLYPPGLDYISAFFGCLYANVIAVPTYPPDPIRLDRTLPRFLSIVRNAQPALGLTTAPIQALVRFLSAQYPDLHGVSWLKTDEITQEPVEENWSPPGASPESLAFLQFTSGSTSEPKGVMLTHSKLMHNLEMIRQAWKVNEGSRGLLWLPFYHDMGLIGGVLGAVYCDVNVTWMSPLHFIQHPLYWLEAITQARIEISGGPNFAYDLCIRKITSEQRANLDLSSWKVAFNGAEPIRAETIERFSSTFARCGFRKEAFLPCYGLAEATLLVSSGKRSYAPVFKTVQANLARDRVVLAGPDDPNTRTLVSSGHPCAGQEVRIVDPESRKPCPEGHIGEIWVSGPSIASGYWNQTEASQQTFQAYLEGSQPGLHPGPYLRTGDLGFLQDGDLFITGRIKDLIIVQGLNHYPQDIEITVEKSHPALRPGACAAFAIDRDSKDQVVVVAEVSPSRGKSAGEPPSSDFNPEEVRKAIRQAVSEAHELRLHEIVLIRPGSLPKTSSGKIQRYACRRDYQAGLLEAWKP